MPNDIDGLWPDAFPPMSLQSPEAALEEMAVVIGDRTQGLVLASVDRGTILERRDPPYRYFFVLRAAEWSVSDCFPVLGYERGLLPYPVELLRERRTIWTRTEFLDYVREALERPETREAIRYFLALHEPGPTTPDLWPADLDLTPLSSPASLVAKQARAICDHTNGLIAGQLTPSSCCDGAHFSFDFELTENEPQFGMLTHPLTYRVFTVLSGPDFCPVVVHPGGLEFKCEADFTEFVRQELASETVRNAIGMLLGKCLLGKPKATERGKSASASSDANRQAAAGTDTQADCSRPSA